MDFLFRNRLPLNTENSSALTEGLGDIWGATLEHYYAPEDPNETWKIGERAVEGTGTGYRCLRNLKYPEDPEAYMPTISNYLNEIYHDPATNGYMRSGVLSHWFYLLIEGGCNRPIGWEKATRLVFLTQRNYLTLYTADNGDNLAEIRNQFNRTVHDLVTAGTFTVADSIEIEQAWKDVGVLRYPMEVIQANTTILGNVTWSTPKRIESIVNIEGTLTITTTVHCKQEGEFLIKSGGKLIIDGGTLTNMTCNDPMWQGIKVLGNSNEPQTNTTQNGQGQLIIKNNAVIEHAVCAIKNYGLSNGNIDYNTTGGRISATNSRFTDNAQMVSLMPYSNAIIYGTKFTNCTFEILPTYSFDKPISSQFVEIKGIKTVQFYGCDFTYPYYAAPDFPNSPQRSPYGLSPAVTAIRAFNTQLTVQARSLCPTSPRPYFCNNYDSCTFTGFADAIDFSYSSGGTNSVTIDRTCFNKNLNGVTLWASPSFKLTHSNFKIGQDSPSFLNHWVYGAKTYNTPVFEIYENSFEGVTAKTTGIQILNSRTNNSYTYKNNFNKLHTGQHFMGYNKIIEGVVGHNEGLRYLCNENTDNILNDVLVDSSSVRFLQVAGHIILYPDGTSTIIRLPIRGQGVAYNQAMYVPNDILRPGNRFSSSVMWHITDYVDEQLHHSHGDEFVPAEQPERTRGNINIQKGKPNSCLSLSLRDMWQERVPLSDISISGGKIDPDDNSTLAPVYQYYQKQYVTLLDKYERLLDGGNTATFMETVQKEWSKDVWRLRQELLKH
jgi:hypothetical protein